MNDKKAVIRYTRSEENHEFRIFIGDTATDDAVLINGQKLSNPDYQSSEEFQSLVDSFEKTFISHLHG